MQSFIPLGSRIFGFISILVVGGVSVGSHTAEYRTCAQRFKTKLSLRV